MIGKCYVIGMYDIRKGTCPLCGHNEIVQAAPVEWAHGVGPVLLAASHERGLLGPKPQKPFGALNVFVCRRCGFAQWFAFEPGDIPIGEDFGTRLIRGPESGGPYR
jgi:hypothetical protein